MKCVICGETIGKNETRSSVSLHNWDKFSRHIFACVVCSIKNGPFDRLIDALPTDGLGRLQDMSNLELQALVIATDRKKLLKRLRAAKTCLLDHYKKAFSKPRFDFRGRRLIGDGFALEWRIRQMPDKAISYHNQQTSIGTVVLIDLLIDLPMES